MIQRIIGRAAAAIDLAVVAAMQSRRRSARLLSHDERMRRLAAIRDAYGRPAADDFFPAPPAPAATMRRVREGVFDATWPSASIPWLEGFRPAYLAHEANRRVHARLFLGPSPRPAVILIHGYLGGHWSVEERAWPIAWMQRRGLDVALAVLPFHALRADGPPRLPGADPRYTNEGFRQAVSDLRALVKLLRARGAPSVGVMGMSLGGYTTALLSTVERELAFAVPVIPLASVADFARDHGQLNNELEHRALEEANEVVSPLARPGRLPGERMLVVGAGADRITPIAQAERLARHFGAPLHRLPGGHLLQVGRGEAFREVRRLWQRLGII